MNSNEKFDEDLFEIDLKSIINAVMSRLKMIVVFALAFALSAFIISNFVMVPKYRATITMCISNSKTMISDSFDINDVNAGIALVPTYVELIQSNNVLGEVAAKTQDLGYTIDDIYSMISISTKEETQIITLNVTNPNPEHANIIANAIADIAPDKITDLMEGSAVKVVDESVLPEYPVSPNVFKYTILGFLFGGFLGVALAILSTLLDTTIKTENDITELYPNIPVLGVIPTFVNQPVKNKSENQ